jgi:hypothetical protein
MVILSALTLLVKAGIFGTSIVVINRVVPGSGETVARAVGKYLGLGVGGLRTLRHAVTSRSNRPNAVRTGLQKVGVGYNRLKYDIWSATRFRPQPLPPPSQPSQGADALPAQGGSAAAARTRNARPPEALAQALSNDAHLNAAVTGSAPPPPASTQSAGDIFADYHRERRTTTLP